MVFFNLFFSPGGAMAPFGPNVGTPMAIDNNKLSNTLKQLRCKHLHVGLYGYPSNA